MLYFYFNSNEIEAYLNKSFTHFGDYNFQKYLLKKQSENVENTKNNKSKKEAENNKEEEKEENIISKLIERIKFTDYFFLQALFILR